MPAISMVYLPCSISYCSVVNDEYPDKYDTN